MNYDFQIPPKLKRPWYNDFVNLFNQIDSTLKAEEVARISSDNALLNQILNINFTSIVWHKVDVNTINRPFDSTSLTSFQPAVNGIIEFYTVANFGLPMEVIYDTLRIVACIRAQRYSGQLGGELYMVIETKDENDEIEPLWTFPVQSFNTNSYDPNWIQCAYIVYDIVLPLDIFNQTRYYNFQTYFRSKDGGQVRVANDRITLYYRLKFS